MSIDVFNPSEALITAARHDRDRLYRSWQQLQDQRSELIAELDRLDSELRELATPLRRLGEIIGDQLELDVPDADLSSGLETNGAALSGAAIRRQAVAVALHAPEEYRELHYKDWYERLVHSGYKVNGRDPVAVFLTQISRSPLVIRGAGHGTYGLDRLALRRLNVALRELRQERHYLVNTAPDPDAWSLDTLAAKLHDVTLEVSRTERQLAEAVATIRELGAEGWFLDSEPVEPSTQGKTNTSQSKAA